LGRGEEADKNNNEEDRSYTSAHNEQKTMAATTASSPFHFHSQKKIVVGA